MKRSEVIAANRDAIAEYMASHYRTVLECHGRVQYSLYIWEDGELEGMEAPQGDHGYLMPGDAATRELFFVCTIDEPFFDPWDVADHAAPEDEAEREAEEKELIDWCMEEYDANLDDLLDSIIRDAKEEESLGF